LTILGRELPATRRIKHPTVSRVHSAIFWDGQDLWMVDLFSSNGTRSRDKKFDAARIALGQQFQVGEVRVLYLGSEALGWADQERTTPAHAVGASDVSLADAWEGRQRELDARLSALEERILVVVDRAAVQQQPLAGPHGQLDAALDGLDQQAARREAGWKEAFRLQTDQQEERQREWTRAWEERLANLEARADHDSVQELLLKERQTYQEQLVAVNSELSAELTALRQQAEAAGQDIRRLAGDLAATKETLVALRSDLQREGQQRGAVQDEMMANRASFTARSDSLGEQLQRLAADVAPTGAALRNLEREMSRIQGELSPAQEAKLDERLDRVERGWQDRWRESSGDVERRIAQVERQSLLNQQANADKVATLDGTLTAQIAELRGTLGLLREEIAHQATANDAIVQQTPAHHPLDLPRGRPEGGGTIPRLPRNADEFFATTVSSSRDFTSRAPRADVLTVAPEADDAENGASPQWVINDDMTTRMLDFNTNRERSGLRPRLVWGAVVVGLVLVVVSGTGIAKFWLKQRATLDKPEASTVRQAEESVQHVSAPRFNASTAN
jgi:hypothetical protein